MLNRVYRHGVGRPGAHDLTSGTPVTNFKCSRSLCGANRARDRDGDGIACEKR
jgi:Excalibur calcium-binding domain